MNFYAIDSKHTLLMQLTENIYAVACSKHTYAVDGKHTLLIQLTA